MKHPFAKLLTWRKQRLARLDEKVVFHRRVVSFTAAMVGLTFYLVHLVPASQRRSYHSGPRSFLFGDISGWPSQLVSSVSWPAFIAVMFWSWVMTVAGYALLKDSRLYTGKVQSLDGRRMAVFWRCYFLLTGLSGIIGALTFGVYTSVEAAILFPPSYLAAVVALLGFVAVFLALPEWLSALRSRALRRT